MKKNITYKFVQWSTPEELHEESVRWISQLEFIKTEQHFLDELIKDYTLSLISKEMYPKSSKLIKTLSHQEQEVEKLLKRVKDHNNSIEVMLQRDFSQEQEEQAYREIHYYLKVEIYSYTQKYRKTKEELFDEVKEIMKQEKRRLLK